MWDLIKETVDAVRVAEMESDKIISTAQENARDKKARVISESEKYRADALHKAEETAEKQMQEMLSKCNDYNKQKSEEIEKKAEILKAGALKNFDKTVDAVINALV